MPLLRVYLRTLRRSLLVAALLLASVVIVLLWFPFLGRAGRDAWLLRWSAWLLAGVGVRPVIHGRPPDPGDGGALVVANHVSWLDIYLLLSLRPMHFVSKSEVRAWPVIGWLAENAAGTLFIERARRSDTHRVNQRMADHLRAGECLAMFPEGTTTDGSALLPFYPSLFQPAVEAGTQVWPVLIRYRRPDGGHCTAAAYYGDMSLLTSMRAILRESAIHAEATFLPPIAAAGLHRRELAVQAEAAIRAALADAGRGSAPDTNAHPPADRR